MISPKKYFWIVLFAFTILVFGVQAQDSGQIETRIALSQQSVPAGGSATLAIVFEVPEDYHITELELELFYVLIKAPDGFKFSEPVFPEPVDFEGLKVFKGEVVVRNDFTVKQNLQPGDYKINIEYGYQVCAETGARICYLPQDESASRTIPVLESGVTPIPGGDEVFSSNRETESPTANVATETSLEGRFTKSLEEGSFLAFILVFIAGIFTSFTPCVYPVIPITVGYIGGRADGKRMTGFLLSLFLVLGLATIYSILGVAAAATGSVFGSYAQHPAVIITIAGIFALMGASMLGLFEITVPASIQGKMQTQKRGFLGAYLVGIVTGIVAAPCVGPVLVALLTWVAQTGSMVIGFFLLFTFAIGMGLLFIVIGTFAGALSALPGSGKWMQTVKHGFGAILIGGAIFFLKPLLSAGVHNLLWGILLIAVGVFNGALEFTSEGKKWGKTFGIICLAGGLIFFVNGFKTVFGFSQSALSYSAVEQSGKGIDWIVNDADKGFNEAKSSDKKVLLDFYADWCASCRELEEKTWVAPEFAGLSDEWIFLKLDLTKMTPELKNLQYKYEVRGMPTIIFFNSEGEETGRFSGFKTAPEVINLMSMQ